MTKVGTVRILIFSTGYYTVPPINEWRAVGVGITNDKLDCVVGKVATNRGIWILARLRGLGRVVIGSMHCHTGATNAI